MDPVWMLLSFPTTSARPEVRGTADVGWWSLFPLQLNPPRTHSRLYHHMCLRTVVPFEAKEVLYAWGPVQPANGPPTRTTSG